MSKRVVPEKLEKWTGIYAEELKSAVEKFPGEYFYGVDSVPSVVAKMRVAFERGTYNYEGRAIRSTCRRLGISHTYKAINGFLQTPEEI